MESRKTDSLSPEKAAGGRGLRVVAIGGGTGLSTLLKGLKRFVLWADRDPGTGRFPCDW